MTPIVSSALAIAGDVGFRCDGPGEAPHVREIDGVSFVSLDPQAADHINLNAANAKDVVVVLARGATVTSLVVRGSGHVIAIGAETRVGGVTIYGSDNIVRIGAKTSLLTSNIVRGRGIRFDVGSGCIAEGGGTIRTSDDHTIFDLASGAPINRARDVRLGNRVYLGRNVRVSKGANVGDGVVVGPDSVVAGTLQPGCLYGGVPARLLREKVTWVPRS